MSALKPIVLSAPSGSIGGAMTFTKALWPRLTERLEREGYEVIAINGPSSGARDFLSRYKLLRRSDRILHAANRATFASSARQVVCVRNRLLVEPLAQMRNTNRLRARRLLLMQGILSADVLVVPTAAMQEPLEAFMHDRHLPARPVHVIPHGRPDWTGPPVVRPFSDPLRLLYPSHIGDHKNVDFLPKVLKDLNDAGLEARLTLTATEDESANGIALATWFEENRESVNFKGPVSWHEVRSLFLDHDILLFPSLSEAFGHPLIEGMTTGMPILASDCDWAREICGDAALYADPHDSREWVSAIEVIRQGGFRQNPIGLENATRFDWDRSAESYASLLLA